MMKQKRDNESEIQKTSSWATVGPAGTNSPVRLNGLISIWSFINVQTSWLWTVKALTRRWIWGRDSSEILLIRTNVGYFMHYTLLPGIQSYFILYSFIQLICSIPLVNTYFQSEWKTVWILIRWLLQKPSDLDLQCSQKRINPASAEQVLNNRQK